MINIMIIFLTTIYCINIRDDGRMRVRTCPEDSQMIVIVTDRMAGRDGGKRLNQERRDWKNHVMCSIISRCWIRRGEREKVSVWSSTCHAFCVADFPLDFNWLMRRGYQLEIWRTRDVWNGWVDWIHIDDDPNVARSQAKRQRKRQESFVISVRRRRHHHHMSLSCSGSSKKRHLHARRTKRAERWWQEGWIQKEFGYIRNDSVDD